MVRGFVADCAVGVAGEVCCALLVTRSLRRCGVVCTLGFPVPWAGSIFGPLVAGRIVFQPRSGLLEEGVLWDSAVYCGGVSIEWGLAGILCLCVWTLSRYTRGATCPIGG